jgi:hypothetical protein
MMPIINCHTLDFIIDLLFCDYSRRDPQTNCGLETMMSATTSFR